MYSSPDSMRENEQAGQVMLLIVGVIIFIGLIYAAITGKLDPPKESDKKDYVVKVYFKGVAQADTLRFSSPWIHSECYFGVCSIYGYNTTIAENVIHYDIISVTPHKKITKQ